MRAGRRWNEGRSCEFDRYLVPRHSRAGLLFSALPRGLEKKARAASAPHRSASWRRPLP